MEEKPTPTDAIKVSGKEKARTAREEVEALGKKIRELIRDLDKYLEDLERELPNL